MNAGAGTTGNSKTSGRTDVAAWATQLARELTADQAPPTRFPRRQLLGGLINEYKPAA